VRQTGARIPEEGKERFLAKVETWEDEASLAKQKKIEALRHELASLKAKLERLNNAFADGGLDLHEFKERRTRLCRERLNWNSGSSRLREARQIEPLKNWIIEANQAGNWASEDDQLKMKGF
jgi:hypothetical protein